MAEDTTVDAEGVAEETEKKSGSVVMAIVWSTVGMLFGAGGFAIPMIYPGLFTSQSHAEVQTEQPEPDDAFVKSAYIEFDEAVVNLSSDRLNRYLRVKITLMVKESDEEEITKLVEDENARLKSWLLSYLSDVTMEDIRGAAGQNRLRREMQNHFNSVLFTDGYDRIRDVLFLEFNVQ